MSGIAMNSPEGIMAYELVQRLTDIKTGHAAAYHHPTS
jgi:hypothetical protein